MTKFTLTLNHDSSKASIEDVDLMSTLDASLEAMRTTKIKFRLTNFGAEGVFLPSLDSSIDYITGMSFKQALAVTEKKTGRPMPVSRSSRFEMFNRGVGYPTTKKILKWLDPLYTAFFSRCDELSRTMVNRGIRESSSAGNWLCFLSGFRASEAYKQAKFAAEYRVQIDFILQRCDAELEMVNQIRDLIASEEVDKQDTVGIMQVMQPYWQKFSLVPKDELQLFVNALTLHASGKLVDEESISALLRSFCFMKLDFYLNLFASYEVGCVLTYRNEQSELTIKKGLLCRALTQFSKDIDDSKIGTCFGELLEEIRDVISKNFGKLSIREMARHIPIKSDLSNPSAETDSERCYNTLKAWRKGKEVPGHELLETFLSNLTEKISSGHNEQLILLCKMALGIDDIRKRWADELSKVNELKSTLPLLKVFSEVIGRYELYYQHHLELQLNKNIAGNNTGYSESS